MRTVEATIYKIGELSEEAVEKAYQKWQENDYYPWYSENESALKAFEEIFPVYIKDWRYGGHMNSWVKSSFKPSKLPNHEYWCEDSYEEMSGHRLAKFIWNNYSSEITKGKYYSKSVSDERRYVSRHSKIQLVDGDCPFTGYCADNYLLDPIFKFLKAPDDRKFPELMEDCLSAWAKGCAEDLEGSRSLEAFKEDSEANEWEYYEDGTSY